MAGDRAQHERNQHEELCQWLKTQYRDARVLPDGSVAALVDLLFTRAIALGCNREGWSRRFCFEDRELATRRFLELRSEDDVPEVAVAQRDFRSAAKISSEL